jgi:hypothetical protein
MNKTEAWFPERGGRTMKMVLIVLAAAFLFCGLSAMGHAFTCTCKGSTTGDWMYATGLGCGNGYVAGNNGKVVNNIGPSDIYYYMDYISCQKLMQEQGNQPVYSAASNWSCTK